MILLLIGVGFFAATAALVARAIWLPRLQTETALATLGAYGYPVKGTAEHPAGTLSAKLDRLAERVGAAVLPRVGARDEDQVRTLIASAGAYATTPVKFLGYRVLSAVGLTATWLWLGPVANLPASLFILFTPLIALCGWTIPLSLLRVRADRRLDRIEFQLPELVDSLVVTVEAGMGFGGALRMAAREMPAPLGQELQLALQEEDMGLSTHDALENLSKRVPLPAMASFVRSVLQGETLGVSIGEILRGIAVEMRERRRAKAEQRAQQAPVKMVFPLVLCIFPAIMIVILYSPLSNIFRAFGG
jgi:tight adherence protein C